MIWIFIYKNRMNSYENKNLIEEINKRKLNSEIKVLDPNNLSVLVGDDNKYYYENKIIKKPNKVWVKLGCMTNEHTKDIIGSLNNVTFINELKLLNISANKFLTAKVMKKNKIKYIKTMKFIAYNNNIYENVINEFDFPLVIKSKIGSLGKGVYKISSEQELKNMLEQINLLDENYEFLIQEYIKEANIDYRVVLHNGNINYIIKRKAPIGEFKTNFNLQPEIELIKDTKEFEYIANTVYKAIPLNIMGIDIIKKNDEYIVCEINSNPGFKSKDKLEGNFVKELLDFVIKN